MIQKLHSAHENAAMEVARATGLFEEGQLTLLRQMFRQASSDDGQSPFWIGDGGEEMSGVIYCEPERMTDGTWNLQLIAVHPARQKQGIGTRLLQEAKRAVGAKGGRLLLVETAGVDEFSHVRAFYRKHGFTEEARVRDFYAAGVDKITFTHALPNAAGEAAAGQKH